MPNRVESDWQGKQASRERAAARRAIPAIRRTPAGAWFEPSKSVTAVFMLVVAAVLLGLVWLSDAPAPDKAEHGRRTTIVPGAASAVTESVIIRIFPDGRVRVSGLQAERNKK